MAISTSTNLPPQTDQSFFAKYKKPISQSYGIIEVGLPIGYLRSENDSPFQEKISSQIGKAFPDFEIAFADESLKVDPSLNSGLLALRGPGLFDAYINPFKTSNEVLADSWFITGDYASRDDEGNISLLGRSSSVIHLAGHKIFPEEIEAFLLQHPDILEAQVKGLPHEIFGSIIHANIIKSPSASINESAIIKLCKEELGRLKTPQTIDFVDMIDKTKSGKAIRH